MNKYPYEEWKISENKFETENNYIDETVFTLGNGYIGMRGNFEEGYTGPKGTGFEGIYINGFYESEIIKYGEVAYAYAEKSQTMLNVTDSKIIKLYLEDEEFNMLTGEISDYERVLDMKKGLLKRVLVWVSPKGKKVKIDIERVVSFYNKHLICFKYEVIPINFDGKIRIVSALNGDVTNLVTENDPRVGSGLQGRVLNVEDKNADMDFAFIKQKTKNTKLSLVCAMENRLNTTCNYANRTFIKDLKVEMVYEIEAIKNKSICLNKYIAYTTTKDFDDLLLVNKAKEVLNIAKELGYEGIKEEQKRYLDNFWYRTDVKIKGDKALQQGIRFNMYHLLQSVGRDGKTNIAAKGLTGEGYEGHYFWDTETYILPFFLYNNPEISRKLLEYRYSILDKARERAKQMGISKGALFPWRTINGEECSAYYPAGTAQYHIDADIALAIKRYMDASKDKEFLVSYGAEILFETARMWYELGDFIESKENKFCINCVTGPDEYTAIVNNNTYTNLMAKENLEYAFETAAWMKKNNNKEYIELCKKINIEEIELENWKKAADNIYIAYDENRGIYLQDDSFMDKKSWNFENTPKENYPLLMHYHPLVIYRHQVCKQGDIVLVEFLLSNKFSKEQKKRDYDFYEPLTTHDSSLSKCIFSIIAAEVGYYDEAYEYFMSTARMDLDNHQGNTKDGIHAANMAGTWMSLVNGFAGMRVYDGVLSFNPYIPENLEEYTFKVTYRGRLIEIKVNKEAVKYKLLEGETITILDKGKSLNLK
jgi:alpha,alpha-trehalose phosphorylase